LDFSIHLSFRENGFTRVPTSMSSPAGALLFSVAGIRDVPRLLRFRA